MKSLKPNGHLGIESRSATLSLQLQTVFECINAVRLDNLQFGADNLAYSD